MLSIFPYRLRANNRVVVLFVLGYGLRILRLLLWVLLLLLLLVVRSDDDGCTRRQHLSLAQCRTQRSVLDAQLVDERTALLPSAIRLVCRGEGSIQKLRARLESLKMSGRKVQHSLRHDTSHSLVATLAECTLGLAVLLGPLARAELAALSAILLLPVHRDLHLHLELHRPILWT